MSHPARGVPEAWAVERMTRAMRSVREALARESRLHPDAPEPRPELPVTWLLTLREAAERLWPPELPAPPAPLERLFEHYLDRLPAALGEQLARADEPGASLFHTPVAWHRLPRLGRALRRLGRMAREAGVPAERVLGAPSPSALSASRPTLARLYAGTCFGASSPLIYATPGDLASYAGEAAADEPVAARIDRRLAAPLVHELSHLGRRRSAARPPIVDECISGWLGVSMLPELLWPAPGADDALMGAGWLAQTGQLLFHLVGRARLLRAHAGLADFAEVLPGDLAESFARLGWQRWDQDHALHFLSGHDEPEPMARLIWLAAAGAPTGGLDPTQLRALPLADLATGPVTASDRAILRAGVRAMALRTSLHQGGWRVRAAPPPGPVAIDARAGVIAAPPDPDRPDLEPLRWVLPPSVARALQRAGVDEARIAPFAPEEAPAVAAVLARGRLPRPR